MVSELWIPILVCTHWLYCSGKPIEGKPVASYEICQQILSTQRDLFGDDNFMDHYVVTKCERRKG
jgi:hypothetical protein